MNSNSEAEDRGNIFLVDNIPDFALYLWFSKKVIMGLIESILVEKCQEY
jgi:hypothetical protein